MPSGAIPMSGRSSRGICSSADQYGYPLRRIRCGDPDGCRWRPRRAQYDATRAM
jgi:hypothetical protein